MVNFPVEKPPLHESEAGNIIWCNKVNENNKKLVNIIFPKRLIL